MKGLAGELIAQSKYDLMTAVDLLKAGRFIYSVYMCHLAAEKALKALVVINTGSPPPKIHNLIQLAKLGSAKFTEEQKAFIAEINTASISTRYPEELASSLVKFNQDMAGEYLQKTEDVIKCIIMDPRLK